MLLGGGVGFEIGDIVPHPQLLALVPPNLPPQRIPRFAVQVARRAVVKDAAVGGPRPRPVRINPESRWIVSSATLNHCARFSPRTRVDPVAAGSCAIIFEPGKARKLLPGLDCLICLRISDIGKRFAINLLRNLRE